jgi:predicted glycoside hydrolase/deacetylase ChbG (UPF0249 family)
MNLAQTLGLPEDAKIVVAHHDDTGMCHGSNAAFADLFDKGFITATSVMVPCPWFRELAEMTVARPDYDIGVHLTLTSEWKHYRWRPLIGSARSTGLVDGDGYMWRTARETREHADPAAVEEELRAQVETALAAGIRPTHLDCHMATAMAPEFIDIYLRLGEELDLPVLYTRFWNGDAAKAANVREQQLMEDTVRRLEARGNPVFLEGLETPWGPEDGKRETYERLLDQVKPGLTILSLHPNQPGDINVIDPERCHCRIGEWQLFQDDSFIQETRNRGIHLIGFRAIAEAMAGAGRNATH